jgi:hypothetical protein
MAMKCECGPSHLRNALDLVAFLATLAVGLILIGQARMSADGLAAAAYLTSIYSAWRAGAIALRRPRQVPPAQSPEGDAEQ